MKLKLKTNDIQKTIFGNTTYSKKEGLTIFFYDYDGTLLHSYSNVDFLNLNSLPSLPDRTSDGLTCDGWNWTLQQIKDQIKNVKGDVCVGAIYHTTDNKTHVTCKPNDTYPTAYINLTPTVANDVTVDWGDGTTDIWTTTSATTKSHTYTVLNTNYDITISCTSGTYSFASYFSGSTTNNQNSVFTSVKLSNTITSIYSNCFNSHKFIKFAVIPNNVLTSVGSLFSNCSSLQFFVVPNSVISIGLNCFNNCQTLQYISVSSSVTLFDTQCFQNCIGLLDITIPYNAKFSGTTSFKGCTKLQHLNIPVNTTALGSYCIQNCYSLLTLNIPVGVKTIGDQCVRTAKSLMTVVIPSTVTSISSGCFRDCTCLYKIYVKPMTPPTLGSTTAIPNNANLVIYVPRGTLSAYQSASNWSTYSSKMVEYDY